MSFFFLTSAQINDSIAWRKVDSINRIISTTKGRNKIDCYNLLAECYLQIWDDDHVKQFDTACTYANMAYEEAKKINYRTGVGYAKAALLWQTISKIDDDKNNNDTEPAYIETYRLAQEVLAIADQLKDDCLAGLVYNDLIWVEKWKAAMDSNTRFQPKLQANTEKAIQHFEKITGNEFKGRYKPLMLVNCAGCKGAEAALASLHGALAVFFIKENNPHAKDEVNLAIHYCTMIGDMGLLGSEFSQLAQIFFLNYDYKRSEQAYFQAKEYFHQADEAEAEIAMLNEVSKIYEIRGDFENGIAAYKNSIKLIEEFFKNKSAGSATSIPAGQTFFWMARLYMVAGDYETALDILRQGRQYYPTNGNSAFIAPWMAAIGDVHRLMGNYDSAMYYLKYFQNTDNSSNNFGKVSLGYLYVDLKDYSKALSLILPFYQNLKNIHRITPPIVHTLIIAGNASLGEGKYEQALQYAKEAQDYLIKMDGRVLMISNYKLLSEIYDKENKPDSAYAYLKLYTTLKDSLINRQFYFKLNSLKIESEEQRKTSQINLLNKENLLKESQLKQQATLKKSLIAGLILLALLGIFIFRNQSLKQKNERLRLQKKIELKELESKKKQVELQQQSSDLKMQALRAQMNPHFIFNCLSSINKFILKNESQAASDYLTRFSRLIRRVLTNSQLSMIPLSDEIEMLKLYLDMERLRFDNAFDYNIVYANTIEPETIYIPPMLLQPFCENAIWHGLMHKEGKGKLEIEMRTENRELHCMITDNGIGRLKAAELKSKSGERQNSLGLKITSERLALFNSEKISDNYYCTDDVLDVHGNIVGTKVSLVVNFKDAIHELINS